MVGELARWAYNFVGCSLTLSLYNCILLEDSMGARKLHGKKHGYLL
jgi:hypothetical protein